MQKTYADLQKEFPGTDIPYGVLLLTKDWMDRRERILTRDDWTCQNCKKGVREIVVSRLQAHHFYYIVGKLPWDYPDKALGTLCVDCHDAFHQTAKVPWYEMRDGQLLAMEWI